MAWIVLVLSGICEAVWAVALDKSQGFTKIIPVIVFFCGLAASMAGLSYAMRSISVDRLCDLGRYRGRDYRGIWHGRGRRIRVGAQDPVPHRHGRVHRRPQTRELMCVALCVRRTNRRFGSPIDLCGGWRRGHLLS